VVAGLLRQKHGSALHFFEWNVKITSDSSGGDFEVRRSYRVELTGSSLQFGVRQDSVLPTQKIRIKFTKK
jgi:hypothetical protein